MTQFMRLGHVRAWELVVIIIKWTIIANYATFSCKISVWLMIGIVQCYFMHHIQFKTKKCLIIYLLSRNSGKYY